MVVTPAVHFGSDSAWPVYVVDDQYFNHVLTIGEVPKLSVRGAVLERVRLDDGAHPTGTQFRDLLSMAAHVATLHAGGGGFYVADRTVRDTTFTEFIPTDGEGDAFG